MIKDGMVAADDTDSDINEDEQIDSRDIYVVDLDVEPTRDCEEGEFCLVEYAIKLGVHVYYVCKVLGSTSDGITVSSLRKSKLSSDGTLRFYLPQIPDLNEITPAQIKALLPKPGCFGGTARQKSAYVFNDVVFPLNIDLR